MRPDTDTILHTHSVLAVLASLMDPQEFSASHLQMVKAMPGHRYSGLLPTFLIISQIRNNIRKVLTPNNYYTIMQDDLKNIDVREESNE